MINHTVGDASFAEANNKPHFEKSATSWDGRSPAWEPHGGSAWEPNRPSLSWEQQRMIAEAGRPSWEIGRPSWSKAPFDQGLNDYSIGSFTPNSMTPMSMYTPSRIMTPGPFMTPSRMTPNYRFTPSRIMGLDRDHSTRSTVTPGPAYLERDHSIRSITPTSSKFGPEQSGADTDNGMTPETLHQSEKPRPHVIEPLIQPPQVPASKFRRLAQVIIKVAKRMLQVPLLYGSVLGFIWSINHWRVPSFLKNSALLCAEQTVGLAMILLGKSCNTVRILI